MKDNWFEDKMNERFEDFDSELDLHAAWADLEERRQPKKKKRRGGIFWWFGAGTAVALVGIGLLFNSTKQTKLSASNETALLENSSTENKFNKNQKSIYNSLIVNSEQADNQSNIKELAKAKSTESKIKNEENYHKEKTLEKVNYFTEKSLNSIQNSQDRNDIDNSLTLLADKNEFKSSNPEINTPIEELSPPVGLIEPLQKDIPSLINEVAHYNIECDFEANFSKKHTFGIAFNYGKAFRDSPIGRGLNSAYFKRRDDAETPLDAWSAQIFYQVKNKKNWLARVNLGYSQTTDLFQDNYATSNLMLMDDQTLQINMYPDGTTEEIKGAAFVKSEEQGTGKFYQRYRQAFIGLEFGKERKLASDFNLRAAVGGDFTVYQKNSGKVYSNDNSTFGSYQDLSDISSTKGGIFAAKLSLEIGKSFGFHNEISFGIVGKTNLNILENDFGRRHYLLSSLSYRKNF